MKIFEEIEYIDGGPNDRGTVIGYHYGISSEQLKKKFNIKHGFINFREISKEEFNNKKIKAWKNIKCIKI